MTTGDPKPSIDAGLLEAWRAGDRASGERLFERHVGRLLRFFRNKVGVQSEELVQRTFLACVESRDRVRQTSSFRAYLFAVARNELHRHLRRSARSDYDPLRSSIAQLGSSPSDKLDRNQRIAQLLGALCQLPVDLQVVLELYYWEELSVAELAEVVGVPEGTVKSRLFRARQLLQAQFVGSDPSGAERGEGFDDIDAWARSVRDAVLAGSFAEPRRVRR